MLRISFVFAILLFLFQEPQNKFSLESVAAFILAVFLGLLGWIGFERDQNRPMRRREIFAVVGMALCMGYIVDSFAWYKGFHPELRAVFVTIAACAAKPLFTYFYARKNTYFKKLFGNDKPDDND